MKKIAFVLVITILSLMFIIGCGQSPSATSVNTPGLENTTWVLQSNGQPNNLKAILTGSEITATFDSTKKQVTGSSGVNQYFGAYKLNGDKLTVPGPLGTTKMAGPQALMDQESEYLTTLQASASYKIESNKITITCGSKVLIFTKK